MSGLSEIGELPGFIPGYGGQVAQRDLDQYDYISIDSPAVNFAWFAAGTSTGTTPAALVLTNQMADWPRNVAYAYTGGTSGGTFVANLIDQFGQVKTETVALGSVAGGGTTYGTVVAMKFLSGTITPNTSTAGTYTLGLGTASGASGNFFGLLTKIGGTADVKNITWTSTNTVTTLAKGTALGTLVNTTTHSFQGTAGVQTTDHYKVILKPTFDNTGAGTMSGL